MLERTTPSICALLLSSSYSCTRVVLAFSPRRRPTNGLHGAHARLDDCIGAREPWLPRCSDRRRGEALMVTVAVAIVYGCSSGTAQGRTGAGTGQTGAGGAGIIVAGGVGGSGIVNRDGGGIGGIDGGGVVVDPPPPDCMKNEDCPTD